jgi:hypothetical protein
MTPLPPQAAIETACVLILREALGYHPHECDRTHRGEVGGRGAKLFVGVWSDGARQSSSRVALDERFGVNATVTAVYVEAMDRWHLDRDRMEYELNRVRATLHSDTWGGAVRRRANSLAGLGDEPARHVGFCEAMYLLSVEAWEDKTGAWFNASTSGGVMGVSQTARFGGMRLVQAVPTAR